MFRTFFSKLIALAILITSFVLSLCVSSACAATDWGFGKTTTIEETVLVEENNVRITATGIEYTNSGVEVFLILENNTEGKLGFLAGATGYNVNAVNGYMVGSGYLNCDVEAGSSQKKTLKISYSELEACGITDIADIELGFRIADDGKNYFYTGPRKIITSQHANYDYNKNYFQDAVHAGTVYKDNGIIIEYFTVETIFSQSGIEVKSWGMVTNPNGDRYLLVEVANESDALVNARTTNLSINDLLVYTSTVTSDTINPGATAIVAIPVGTILDDIEWSILGIEDIGTIGFEFTVIDENTDYKIVENKELVCTAPNQGFFYDSTGVEVFSSDNLRIVYKALAEGSSEYDDDLYAYFIVENKYGESIRIRDSDTLLNGNDVSSTMYNSTIPSGKYAFVTLKFYSYSFEDYDIVAVSDVATIKTTYEIIGNNYKTLDEFEISINTADGTIEIYDPWYCMACGQACNGGSNCTACEQTRNVVQTCDHCDITYVSDSANYCIECGNKLE